jgi:hypothetical protein
MRRSALAAALFVGLLYSSNVQAVPRIVWRLQHLNQTLQPIHLLGVGCFFFTIFVFGRYLEWSATVTLGSALLCGLAVGTWGVWALTGDFVKSRSHSTAAVLSAEKEESTSTAIAPVGGAVGTKCKADDDCPADAICAKVAGSRNCWQPCAANDACPAGFICFATEQGARVCAR